jgi:hypothetical protein
MRLSASIVVIRPRQRHSQKCPFHGHFSGCALEDFAGDRGCRGTDLAQIGQEEVPVAQGLLSRFAAGDVQFFDGKGTPNGTAPHLSNRCPRAMSKSAQPGLGSHEMASRRQDQRPDVGDHSTRLLEIPSDHTGTNDYQKDKCRDSQILGLLVSYLPLCRYPQKD